GLQPAKSGHQGGSVWLAFQQAAVEWINRSRADLDQYLIILWRRLFNLFNFENIGRAVSVIDNGFHDVLPRAETYVVRAFRVPGSQQISEGFGLATGGSRSPALAYSLPNALLLFRRQISDAFVDTFSD